MQGSEFDEGVFFAAIAAAGARALLIGRRAMAALGLPVLTADYDFWVHADDVERFNVAVAAVGLTPTATPEQARYAGRYVLENDEHVDVLVARAVQTVDGETVAFDDVWQRREELPWGGGGHVAVPCLEDLIRTKRWTTRDRDVADARLLAALKKNREA